jgi:uncharacterized protein (DUF983 family)
MNPLSTGMRLQCPKCGQGKIYNGLLTVKPACEVCGLDYAPFDTGDGPAFLVIMLLGFLVVGLAAAVELIWLHVLLWVPFVMAGAILLLRLSKSVLISYQFHHRIGFDDNRNT